MGSLVSRHVLRLTTQTLQLDYAKHALPTVKPARRPTHAPAAMTPMYFALTTTAMTLAWMARLLIAIVCVRVVIVIERRVQAQGPNSV